MNLESSDKLQKIVCVLIVFCIKYSENIYNPGIIAITNVILSVYSIDTDAFVMLSHIFANIYPFVNFYSGFSYRSQP